MTKGVIMLVYNKSKKGEIMEKEKKYLIDNPTLMAEWNWEKNNALDLDPKTLTLGSNKKVWWKCSKGHEWQATINHRNNGRGCPHCSGRKVLKGYNDLATVNPKLATEWNYDKNGKKILSREPNEEEKMIIQLIKDYNNGQK